MKEIDFLLTVSPSRAISHGDTPFFLSCHITLAEDLRFIYDPLYHQLGYHRLPFAL